MIQAPKHGDKLKLSSTIYCTTDSGSFGTLRRTRNGIEVKDWHDCRETFGHTRDGGNVFLFSYRGDTTWQSIAAFIHRFEKKLGMKRLSKFGPTFKGHILWVKMARFWNLQPMRRSLFTILLRCGQSYGPMYNNFENALWSYHYAENTKDAIKRFLKGNTKYIGRSNGWYDQFVDVEEEWLKNLLIK